MANVVGQRPFGAGQDSWLDDLRNTVNAIPGRTGEIVLWGGLGSHPAALVCDGSVLKRASYVALFNAIGTRFNSGGEASDEFRLPSLAAVSGVEWVIVV